jgi:hypothetical protein
MTTKYEDQIRVITSAKPLGAPDIDNSTKEERLEYVLEKWQCCNNCEICGKCSILKGRDAEIVYEDYIEGRCSYMEVTLKIRERNY